MATNLTCIHENAAGIDVGSRSHFVAVPPGRDKDLVREFPFFTEDLIKLAAWLKKCKIETIALEATGSYWLPLFDILSEKGFEVCLVNARHIKNVTGRKSDVLDCQWLQQLHSYGLLRPSFLPDQITEEVRQYARHRDGLIRQASRQLQLIQKNLVVMNLQLQNVVSDISGDTGMAIIRAICGGERDPKELAKLRNPRCKNPEEVIAKSLVGNYKAGTLFALKQALATYDHYQRQIAQCNIEIERSIGKFEDRSGGAQQPKRKREAKKNNLGFDFQQALWRVLGINLMDIPCMNTSTALTIISEIGPSVDKWKSPKHFASWLGLCPNNRISGGKRLSGRTKYSSNRIRTALRMAAQTLERSSTALGAFYRRMKARLGAPKAITAAAHKLAVLIYRMIKGRMPHNEKGPLYFEQNHKERSKRRLQRLAEQLGYDLVEKQQTEEVVMVN